MANIEFTDFTKTGKISRLSAIQNLTFSGYIQQGPKSVRFLTTLIFKLSSEKMDLNLGKVI